MPAAAARDILQKTLRESGGWIPFSRYLEIVLHHPQAGFYGSGRARFGADGDFITAPAMSPLFSALLARQVAQVLQHCGGDILELGAGDGTMAEALLQSESLSFFRGNYYVLETSAALQQRQKKRLGGRAQWLNALPDSFNGIILANEVLDALPFCLFAKCEGEWQTRGVEWRGEELTFCDRPAKDDAMRRRLESFDLPDGYQTEVNPRAEALTATLCKMLKNGALLVADYGFGRAEYYHPQRSGGTMMCHRMQKADDNPLESPGEKDITAHVDFTAVAEAGEGGGAQLAGYVSQAQFLINCGAADYLQKQCDKLGAVEFAKFTAGAQKLLSPNDMGELFKVAVFTQSDSLPPLVGFQEGDRRNRL